MAKVITLSFAVIGVALGFFAGSLLAIWLNYSDGYEGAAMSCVFGGAIVFAVLFRWAAGVLLPRVAARFVPVLGSVVSSLAIASVVLLFTRIK